MVVIMGPLMVDVLQVGFKESVNKWLGFITETQCIISCSSHKNDWTLYIESLTEPLLWMAHNHWLLSDLSLCPLHLTSYRKRFPVGELLIFLGLIVGGICLRTGNLWCILVSMRMLLSFSSSHFPTCSSLSFLQVPHFNHEFVYEAILMVMEDGSERAFDLIFKLMKEAAQENILTIDQLKTGFQRIFDDLNDIVLDVPSAFSMTEKFSAHCQQTGVIPAELLKKFPVRGRKRFASENDGGRFKAEEANFREEVRNRVESNSVPLEAEEESGTK